jgi:hypothetical protein
VPFGHLMKTGIIKLGLSAKAVYNEYCKVIPIEIFRKVARRRVCDFIKLKKYWEIENDIMEK